MSTKSGILRIGALVVVLTGMYINVWFFLIFLGILFIILFNVPVEIFAAAILFEVLSGVPLGVVLLPLFAVFYFQKKFRGVLFETRVLSYAILFFAGLAVFLAFHAFLMLVFGAKGILSFQVATLF